MLRIKKLPPYSFVLDELESIAPETRSMFGCTAIYHGEKIVLILRQKEDHRDDNGIWIGTTAEHHESLQKDFPSMRSIKLFGPGPTAWQNLPEDAPDFEESAFKVCRLILQGDPRIGKVPKKKKVKSSAKASSRAKASRKSPGPRKSRKTRSSRKRS